MSADNGVYILVTKRGHNKREYRVVECQCVDNITFDPDYPLYNFPIHAPQLNADNTISLFGKARVFTDQKIAEGYAQCLLDITIEKYGICEYGIVWLDYSAIRFPKSHSPRAGEQQGMGETLRALHRACIH